MACCEIEVGSGASAESFGVRDGSDLPPIHWVVTAPRRRVEPLLAAYEATVTDDYRVALGRDPRMLVLTDVVVVAAAHVTWSVRVRSPADGRWWSASLDLSLLGVQQISLGNIFVAHGTRIVVTGRGHTPSMGKVVVLRGGYQ